MHDQMQKKLARKSSWNGLPWPCKLRLLCVCQSGILETSVIPRPTLITEFRCIMLCLEDACRQSLPWRTSGPLRTSGPPPSLMSLGQEQAGYPQRSSGLSLSPRAESKAYGNPHRRNPAVKPSFKMASDTIVRSIDGRAKAVSIWSQCFMHPFLPPSPPRFPCAAAQ